MRMQTRLAAAIAVHLVLCGLLGLLLVWLFAGPGSVSDPGEPALLREARTIARALVYGRQRPFALCGIAATAALPIVFALWMHSPARERESARIASVAGRAALLAFAGYGLFRAAILLILNLVPFRVSITAGFALLFYELLILAYTLAFIPIATLSFFVVRRLQKVRLA